MFWDGFDKKAGTMANAFATAAKKIGKAPPVSPNTLGKTISGATEKAKNAINTLTPTQKIVGAGALGAGAGYMAADKK